MAKKVKLQAKATEKISADEKQKNLKSMVKHGEILSNVLIENLSQYGNSLEGLLIETYAVCKAYAALKVIALDADWDNEPLLQKMLPWFIDEAKELLAEVKNEENV